MGVRAGARNRAGDSAIAAADIQHTRAIGNPRHKEIVVANEPVLGMLALSVNHRAFIDDMLQFVMDREQARKSLAGVPAA